MKNELFGDTEDAPKNVEKLKEEVTETVEGRQKATILIYDCVNFRVIFV